MEVKALNEKTRGTVGHGNLRLAAFVIAVAATVPFILLFMYAWSLGR